jgi:regulator of cell morphogenesis and NO signaling
MEDIGITTTLAAAVDAFPSLAREFERLGLDYCCGGRRTIGDACRRRGLDPDATVAELSRSDAVDRSAESAEWTTMDPVSLVDHIVATHHRYLWDELPRLTALLERICTVHGERHPELYAVAACYAELRADLEPHLLKEERVLFPMIRELAVSSGLPPFHCGTLRNPISVMLREHDQAGQLLAQLRRLTDGYTPPADGCATYAVCFAAMAELEADTHLHIHKENNVLFPLIVQMESERAAADRG